MKSMAEATHPDTGTPDLAASPIVMPRGLIFLTAMWLVGSWIVAMGIATPVHATSASYEPGVRLMLQIVALGFMIGWPLLRLSQPARPASIRHVLLDLLVLLTLLQVVVWLPRLLTNWLVIRTVALDAMLAGWTVLAAAIVAATVRTNNTTARTIAMLVCVVLCLLGPLMAWFGMHIAFDRPALAMLGPFMSVRDLTESASIPPTSAHWQGIATVWLVASGMWLAVVIAAAFSRSTREEQSENQA
jgi:hypothetical protein